jgi:hypothetical protein
VLTKTRVTHTVPPAEVAARLHQADSVGSTSHRWILELLAIILPPTHGAELERAWGFLRESQVSAAGAGIARDLRFVRRVPLWRGLPLALPFSLHCQVMLIEPQGVGKGHVYA